MKRAPLALIAMLAVACGCSSYDERMTDALAAYRAGDYEAAAGELDTLRQEDAKNAHLYALNRGVVDLARGRPEEAITGFTNGRDALDRIGSPGFLDWFGAALTDDTWLDYAGDDYEQILVRAMLAITDLVLGRGDASAYALQVWERQQEIIDEFESREQAENPKRNYRLVGFGSFVRAILVEDDPTRKDEAQREYERLVGLEPAFEGGKRALQRVEHGKFAPPGHGVVHVIGLVGLGPEKVEVAEQASAQALAIAQMVWAIIRERFTFPNVTAVKIPALVARRDNPTELHIVVDGRRVGATEVVTDVNTVALQQFETVRDWIVARAVIRRAVKIAITEGAKEVAQRNERDRARRKDREHRHHEYEHRKENPLINLGIDLLGNLWTAMERADTRNWTLLPASVQTMRLELPAGDHEISVRAGARGAATGVPQTIRVRVRDGHSGYVVVLTPTTRGGPAPLASHPAVAPTEPSALEPAAAN